MKTYSFNISDVNEQYGYHTNTGTSKEKETKAMSTASGNYSRYSVVFQDSLTDEQLR